MNEKSENFFNAFKTLLTANNRDIYGLKFSKTKSVGSVYLNNYKLCHFRTIKNQSFIFLRNTSFDLLKKCQISYHKNESSSDNFSIRICIDDINIINDFASFWVDLYDEIYMKNNSNTYSFCSRWAECSDKLSCVNPDKSDARLCKYKRNIERGLIFEGKNAVFDENGVISEEKVQHNISLMARAEIVKIDLISADKSNGTQLSFDV